MFIAWPELQRRFSIAAERSIASPGLRLCDLRGSSVFFLLHHFAESSGQPLLVNTTSASPPRITSDEKAAIAWPRRALAFLAFSRAARRPPVPL